MDAVGSNIVVSMRTNEVMRILPRVNEVSNDILFFSVTPSGVYGSQNGLEASSKILSCANLTSSQNWFSHFIRFISFSVVHLQVILVIPFLLLPLSYNQEASGVLL